MKLEEGEDVYCLMRVRYYNDEPFSVEIAYMPYKYVEGIEDYDFSKVSLYDFMAKKDHDPCDFHRSLIVQFPDDRISKRLGNLVESVFRFQYIGFDKEKMSWNIHIVIFEVTNPRIVLEYNFTKETIWNN